MSIELLLARADDGQPALNHGLPADSVGSAPRPKKAARTAEMPTWDAPEADPNDLPLQRWGVIAPSGPYGDAMLAAIAPLIQLREQEQAAPAHIYRVDADMDAKAAVKWRDDVYRAADVPEHERPRYLLILGDLDQVSLSLQQTLAHSAFVGRLHVGDTKGTPNQSQPDLSGYASYAAKVVAHARRASPEAADPSAGPELLFFTADDGTAATANGYRRLVVPCLECARAWRQNGKLAAAHVRELGLSDGADSAVGTATAGTTIDDVGAFLQVTAGPRPAVLLSLSHGVGAPRRGWRSSARQRAQQGALLLGRDHRALLDAEAVSTGPFLPGGLWLCVACFAAGTPADSAFYPWLARLAQASASTNNSADASASTGRYQLQAVLASLLAAGARPFIAAMPQAALANPQGPLAMIGHMDLAWSYGFADTGRRKPGRLPKSRSARMMSALKAWVQGARAGIALDALLRFYRETNDALTVSYQAQADARVWQRPDPTDPIERSHLWMLRNDLRGYVLLGDPAARLPQAGPAAPGTTAAPGTAAAPGTVAVSPMTPPSVTMGRAYEVPGTAEAAPAVARDRAQAAVQALLAGDEAPRAIAARAGVSLNTLWDWLEASRKASRGGT